MPRPELSLVIPIYNEEAVLPQLDGRLRELLAQLGLDSEVVFVDDGSRDRSLELLRQMAGREPRYRVASFSRNFGHQRAITAGMDLSRGKAVVVMDADLQDPPEVILEMVARWRDGFDVVYGRRRSRAGETWFKLFTAKIFYRVFAALIPIEVPLDTGDFRLMSRRVVVTMRALRETHRFVRGLVAWVGFKQTAVEYDRAARAAGETKYPLRKMLAFALDGIASFSILPLRAATYLGLLVGLASVLYGVAAVISFLAGVTVPGWTTIVALVSFLFSVQLLMTGVLGEYVGRIYEQVKGRPLYVVAEKINFKPRRVRPRAPTRDFSEVKDVESARTLLAMPAAAAPTAPAPTTTKRPPPGAAAPPPPGASKPPPPLPSKPPPPVPSRPAPPVPSEPKGVPAAAPSVPRPAPTPEAPPASAPVPASAPADGGDDPSSKR